VKDGKLGFGIIGSGFIGTWHAAAIARAPRAALLAACSRTAERAQKLADRYPGVAAYADHRQLLEHPGLDVVTICTPSGTHADLMIDAARAGKHLICEKPLDITLERIDAAIRVANECNVKLAGIFQRRFQSNSQRLKQVIDSGRLGCLHTIDCSMKWYRSQEYYDSGNWRGTWALDGGGCLMNQGIHGIDLLQWLGGPVRAVTALTATVAHERIEVEDQALALVEFANGARGVLEGSTSCYPGLPTIHEFHGTEGSVGLREDKLSLWRFVGDQPEDEAALLAEANGTRVDAGTGDPKANLGAEGESHLSQIIDMVDAILENRAPACTGADARHSVEIILAIYRSAREGRRVELPL